MMELADSSDEHPQLNDLPNPTDSTTRSASGTGIGIDLNEIPSPSSFSETLSDTFDVVRSFHDNPPPFDGDPAHVPRGVRGSVCGLCGQPEVRGHVVVCDGCERGFHLACTGMRSAHALNFEDWVCGDCFSSGVKSKRWPLGVKSKQLLDINASPPSDGDAYGEDGEELPGSRKHTAVDNSFRTPFCTSAKYRNLLHSGNGYGHQRASDIVKNKVKMGLEDILQQTQVAGRSLDVDLGCPLGSCRSSRGTSVKLSSQNTSEVFLQALREFISERHGVLEEGWCVEIKQSVDSCEFYAIYRAPDGKTFGSVYEVACHLGLMSSMQPKTRRQGSSHFSGKSYIPKRRKPTKSLVANGFADNNESLINDRCKGLLCDGRSPSVITVVNLENSEEAVAEENGGSILSQCYEGFPLQFEDFFVLSLGEIDARPSYHDVTRVYPVGFRSCWHDKVTGSIFINEVLDGGDSGPRFKVRRCTCSAFPIPVGSTVLSKVKSENFSVEQHKEDGLINNGSDENLQTIFSDLSPPNEDDILSCLGVCSDGAFNIHMQNGLHHEASSMGKSGNLSDFQYLRDEIGEISVEDASSSTAWKRMSHDLIKACSELCSRKNTLRFCCNHVGNEQSFLGHCRIRDDCELNSRLAKFCGFPNSAFIRSVVEVENEQCSLPDELEKWLDQDRFGLDMEFVQEILEKIPRVQSCSKYQFVDKRIDTTTLPTVENGVLEVQKFDGEECKEDEPLNFLFRRFKKAKLAAFGNANDKNPPPGKLLCLRIPPELTGDVYQVWDFLSRFHENLGLKEALSLEELEEDLLNLPGGGANILQKSESEFKKDHPLSNALNTEFSNGRVSSKFNANGDPHAFIQMETRVMKEVSEGNLAFSTDSRCMGAALTKAHTSLLRVLITELQSKVAALVDPNFDSGESKPKRGRKKDADSASSIRKMKLNLLPLNELTWPELAHRFILAVLSMDGNLESAEVTARESGRVFRCLQGDGGVLCGSLTGVAGMEADAFLLAEATKQIFGTLNREKHVITIEEETPDTTGGGCEKVLVTDGNMPEWAQVLEPVRKLPTNVGTRIRKCVYDALERNPPEWAKKILEHSISKEVYKGNASGPTKKAVLSLLADICGDGLPQKVEKRRKRITTISISDIVMKQCRIVLRRAAAADDAKVFCNLLGRKLMASSDNDDEGLLGPPAMVARPLDFRTIDLRLAAGSYGGSHEAFLEDVQELWNNLRYAYGDQPDLVELVETLSENFERLYENEVLSLIGKLQEFSKLESLSAETKVEVDSFLVSSNEIPKAPWDEGVCKVCGIDKDDDSVLLCDTCDAEYHTYCLNPPLARIPEGNWYCPSCVMGTRMVEDPSEHTKNHIINLHKGKKFRGEVTRDFLNKLANLAAALEEKEYSEFSVDERLFLLKYLCDELLSSALIRQHLEQCVETSAELQQKLRSCFMEWKNLKSREEVVAARAAKLDTTMLSAVREGQGSCDGARLGASDQYSSLTSLENKCHNHTGFQEQMSSAHDVIDNNDAGGNVLSSSGSQNSGKPVKFIEPPLSGSLPQDMDGSDQSNMETEISILPSGKQYCTPCDANGVPVAPFVPPNESQAYHNELDSIKKDILQVQDSIACMELELLKISVRREFLGSDSAGRLYWASVMSNGQPQIISSGSSVQIGSESRDRVVKGHVFKNYTSTSNGNCSSLDANMYSSLLHLPRNFIGNSPCVSYQTEADILELVDWLKDSDPKERELKESILQWHKPKLQISSRSNNQSPEEQLKDSSSSSDVEKLECSGFLVNRASSLLVSKYGPFLEFEMPDDLNRWLDKTRLTENEKMFRCVCLEPVWPSRYHCLSCHKSFLSNVELEEHDNGKCSLHPASYDGVKEVGDSSKSKCNIKFESKQEESSSMTIAETSKGGYFNQSMGLIKYQNDGMMCPYDFDLICSKFLTKDSNKDLIKEIGLISSNGVPSFVSSVSPYVMESTLNVIDLKKDSSTPEDGTLASEWPSLGNIILENACHQYLATDNSIPKPAGNEISALKSKRLASGCPEPKSKKICMDNRFSEFGIGRCCVIPQSSQRPLVGRILQVVRGLKMNLLDMDAALPDEALRPSKLHIERRWSWRAFVKSAGTIFEMVQATIALEDMIRTEYLKNEWWYWSSLSAAAQISTVSSLALRIFSLDAAIIYEKVSPNQDSNDYLEPSSIPEQKLGGVDLIEKPRTSSRKSGKKRKEPEG
ncbi:methyl-CpG-binding domain-containing protein 9 isoform X2 [Benincasa hispida]|uniref:methyl-CpG-binding domain-containing protein 9 isoform X2 n=1 Tax=Benincasa hispida TaxID=102211 RepID=UPI001902C1A0|nr:methyl-CpG-binding domain-containing protein 9 isoform X2 [Benincasa hispida]